MSTKLEKFIQMHQQELSSLTPSDNLWLTINAKMQAPALIKSKTISSKVSWLKYFAYGASAAAIVVSLAVFSKRSQPLAETKSAAVPAISSTPAGMQSTPELPVKDENKIVVAANTVADTPATEEKAPVALPPVAPVPPVPPVAPVAPVPPVIPVKGLPVPPNINAPVLKNALEWKMTSTGGLKADTSFAGISRVELYVTTCDVNVLPAADKKVSFKADITYESKGIVEGKKEYELKYEVKDSVLRITLKDNCKKLVVIGTLNEEAKILLNVPDQVSLSLKDSYGDIAIDGLKGGKYEIEASSGDVITDNISGDIGLKAGYGDVKMSNIKGRINAAVTSGDTWIAKLEGNAEITSAYGNQTCKDISGKMTIHSASGDTRIGNMNGDLDVRSSYGNISLNGYEGTPRLEAVSGDITGKEVRLKNSMTAKSNYGNIKMALLNDVKELSFDLQTSYGRINVDKDGAKAEDDSRVQIKQGDILITGITTSGDQSYK